MSRNEKKYIISGLLIFISLSAALFASKFLDISESFYSSYDEISSIPNIFEAGWVPYWLPSSASKIKESHNIDTNEAWLMFSFLPSDDFYTDCQKVKGFKASFLLINSESRHKQFKNFVDSLVLAIKDNVIDFYDCDGDSDRVLVVDFDNSYAYVWKKAN